MLTKYNRFGSFDPCYDPNFRCNYLSRTCKWSENKNPRTQMCYHCHGNTIEQGILPFTK